MLLRQLKPSILTAACFFPYFTGTQPPPFLRAEAEAAVEVKEGGDAAAASGIACIGTKLSLLNWES